MKAWLGAAAAVSGVGTLVYLLARSGRRRDTGQSSTAQGTHAGQKATSEGSSVSRDIQDTGSEKDGSHDRLNGHLPSVAITGEAVKQSATDPAEQNSHENPLLSKDASTRESALNVAENVTECVSVVQNKVNTEVSSHIESKETTQDVRVTEAVTEKTSESVPVQHPQEQDSGVTYQQKDTETRQKDAETRENTSDDVLLPCTDSEESNTVASGETALTNVTATAAAIASDETMCSDTNTTALSGTTCHNESTETSVKDTSSTQPEKASSASSADVKMESCPAALEPVVEELSRCLIVKPQCDPSCHEHLPDSCCAPSPQLSTVLPSDTTEASLTETKEAVPEASSPAQQQYTLVLKSEEDVCISGKHIHDSSPDQPAEPSAVRPEEAAEVTKEAPVTTAEMQEAVLVTTAEVQEAVLVTTAEVKKEDTVTTAEVNKEVPVTSAEVKETPVTCTVITEQAAVVDHEQPSEDPASSPIEEKCTLKESVLVSSECIGDERKECVASPEAAVGETNDNTVNSTPQEPREQQQSSRRQEAPREKRHSLVEPQIIVTAPTPVPDTHIIVTAPTPVPEELTDSMEEESQDQDHSVTKQEKESEKELQSISKENKQEKQEQSRAKGDLKQEQGSSKQDKVTKQELVTIEQEKSDSKEKVTKKEETTSNQDKTKKQKQTSNEKEVAKEQKQSNKRQESPREHRQTNKKQEAAKEHQQSSRRQEAPREQRQGNRKQEQNDKQEKSKKQEDSANKDRSNNQQTSKRREQSAEKQDVPAPYKSVKEVVTEEQIVTPSTKGDGGKKGSVRSRGDSASADLDCDLGSEQDNMNCDSSSLKSMDSGQGSSEIEPETLFGPANFPVSNQEQYIFYDFEIPQMLVGRLIGRKGAFINKIKAATDATVIVHPHKNRKLKLCSVEGTRQQVNAALEMIRKHFPESQYPDITLQQVSSQPQAQPQVQPQVNAQSMQIELTAGVVVEVRVSAVVSGGEMWVQQPLHPSYSALHRLQTCMNLNYGDGSNTPPLPGPISDGTVCVAHINDHWMRCQVLSSHNAMSVVLLLDIGGTVTVPSSSLRQIRYDYMTLPFQASQCFLHGVQPVTGDMWSEAATSVMEELVSGVILFAVVVSYTEDYVPLINLYRRDQDQFVLLNEKLVELGHAQWISSQHSS